MYTIRISRQWDIYGKVFNVSLEKRNTILKEKEMTDKRFALSTVRKYTENYQPFKLIDDTKKPLKKTESYYLDEISNDQTMIYKHLLVKNHELEGV